MKRLSWSSGLESSGHPSHRASLDHDFRHTNGLVGVAIQAALAVETAICVKFGHKFIEPRKQRANRATGKVLVEEDRLIEFQERGDEVVVGPLNGVLGEELADRFNGGEVRRSLRVVLRPGGEEFALVV